MKTLLSVLIFLALLQQVSTSRAEETPPFIKIGAIYGITGPLPEMNADFRDGALLAAEEFNSAHAIKLQPVFEDSRWQPREAVNAFQKLSETEGVQFFHVTGASMNLALKPLCEEKHLLLFASAAHPGISENSRYVLRHGNSADADAAVLSEAIKKKAPGSVAGLYAQNDWGEIFDSNLRKDLEVLPGLHYESTAYLPEDVDFKSQIMALIKSGPDAFVVGAFGPQAGIIIRELKQLGYGGRIVANNGLVLSDAAMRTVRESGIKGFEYQTYPDLPEDFVKVFQARFHRVPGFWAMSAYADYELLGYALDKAGPEPKAVASYVRGLKSFNGRFGKIDIAPSGDMIIGTVVKVWH